jgi:hypothetical protein
MPVKEVLMLLEEVRGGNADHVLLAPPERGYGPKLLVKLGQELV